MIQALEKVYMSAHASQEQRLLSFCAMAKTLMMECLHQQFLKVYGLTDVWTVKFYLTRLMFVNAIIMNCLILVFQALNPLKFY